MAESGASNIIPQSGKTECDTTSNDLAEKKAVDPSHEAEVGKESTPETKKENSKDERKGEAKIKAQ